MTADPYVASGGVGSPASWNRYAYVEGDPVNALDPQGLSVIGADDPYTRCLFSIPHFMFPQDAHAWVDMCGAPRSGTSGEPRPRRGPTVTIADIQRDIAAEREQTKVNDALKVALDCLKDAVLDHYGFNVAAGALTVLGAPVYKGWVPPGRVIGNPSTTILSAVGHFISVEIPRVANTANLLRAAGRISGPVGAALLAYDIISITIDTWSCYQEQTATER